MVQEQDYENFVTNFRSDTASWDALDCVVDRIRSQSPQKPIWKAIVDRPLDENSVKTLRDQGVIIEQLRLSNRSRGFALLGSKFKMIYIDDRSEGYERDLIAFHELEHHQYPKELFDGASYIKTGEFGDISPLERMENRIIADWLSRLYRANPHLLRAAILAFGLEPHIYDASSYEAFGEFPIGLHGQLRLALPDPYFEFLHRYGVVRLDGSQDYDDIPD